MMCRFKLNCIRTLETIKRYCDAGANIIIGTKAIGDMGFGIEACRSFEEVSVGLDAVTGA